MKRNTLLTGFLVAGILAIGSYSLKASLLSDAQASVQPEKPSIQIIAQASPAMSDATGLTIQQKVELLTQNKGKFGSGDALRRFFFGDLEPLGVQPGGAGMVVNLYNKTNNMTFSYCSTYDVVVAMKTGRITAFDPSEVK
jgi:hypothetical protein